MAEEAKVLKVVWTDGSSSEIHGVEFWQWHSKDKIFVKFLDGAQLFINFDWVRAFYPPDEKKEPAT